MQDVIDIKEFYSGLDLMLARKNTVESERYLSGYLQAAEQKQDIAGTTAICNELGGLYRVTGRLSEAKEIYGRVLNNLKTMGLQGTEHYAAALINAGDVYISAKENQQALEFFKEAEPILEKCGLHADYRMAALYNNVSAIYRELGDLAGSEEAAREAFDVIIALPQYKTELATTYINLAEVQIRQGKYETAKENLLAAIKIFEQHSEDVHYSAANAALGEVCYYQGDYTAAEQYYNTALKLIERDFGRPPYYEIVQRNLDKVQEKLHPNGISKEQSSCEG